MNEASRGNASLTGRAAVTRRAAIRAVRSCVFKLQIFPNAALRKGPRKAGRLRAASIKLVAEFDGHKVSALCLFSKVINRWVQAVEGQPRLSGFICCSASLSVRGRQLPGYRLGKHVPLQRCAGSLLPVIDSCQEFSATLAAPSQDVYMQAAGRIQVWKLCVNFTPVRLRRHSDGQYCADYFQTRKIAGGSFSGGGLFRHPDVTPAATLSQMNEEKTGEAFEPAPVFSSSEGRGFTRRRPRPRRPRPRRRRRRRRPRRASRGRERPRAARCRRGGRRGSP